jgi:hypothetical protein
MRPAGHQSACHGLIKWGKYNSSSSKLLITPNAQLRYVRIFITLLKFVSHGVTFSDGQYCGTQTTSPAPPVIWRSWERVSRYISIVKPIRRTIFQVYRISLYIWNEKPTDVTIWILFIYRRISTYFGPTGPSSGEFTQLFTQPLVQWLYRSGRVLCML